MFRKIINALAIVIILVAAVIPRVDVQAASLNSAAIDYIMNGHYGSPKQEVISTFRARSIHPEFNEQDWKNEKQNFIKKIEEVAAKLSVDPNVLFGIMLFESASTLDPSIINKYGCIGLVQFCPGAGLKTVGNELNKCLPISIRRLVPAEQMDCVFVYFKANLRATDRSLSTMYAVVNWPIAQHFGPTDPWYCKGIQPTFNGRPIKDTGPGTFEAQAGIAQDYATRDTQGHLCINKTSFTTGLNIFLKSTLNTDIIDPNEVTSSSFTPTSQVTTDEGRMTVLNLDLLGPDDSWLRNIYSVEEVNAANTKLQNIQEAYSQDALNNSTALPLNLFEDCSVFNGVKVNTSLNGLFSPNQILIGCIKTVINYVFIIAVITVLISVAAKNLGVVLNSGEGDGANPVANARNTLEKGIIGLLLIGAPALFLDLFSSNLTNLDAISLDNTSNFSQVSVYSDYTSLLNQIGDFNYTVNINNSESQTNTEQTGITEAGVDGIVTAPGRGGQDSQVSEQCKTQFVCTSLNVAYVAQNRDNTNKMNPYGATACGATSAVMLANYAHGEYFNLSSGNNPDSLSLRDNIFTANAYMKNKLKTQTIPSTSCDYTIGPGNVGGSQVDGAWKYTGDDWRPGVPGVSKPVNGILKKLCRNNTMQNIQTYLTLFDTRSKRITGNYSTLDTMYQSLKSSIDNKQPVLVRFDRPGWGGHIAVIKGYTNTPGYFVFNDPWGNVAEDNSSLKGNGIIYDLNPATNGGLIKITSMYAISPL